MMVVFATSILAQEIGESALRQMLSAVLLDEKLNPIVRFSGTFTAYDTNSQDSSDILVKSSFTTTLDTGSKLKIKIVLDPELAKWKNGPIPYYKSRESISFNGKYWIDKKETADDATGSYSPKLAVISDAVPAYIGGSHLTTGEEFLISRTLIGNTGRDYTLRELLSGGLADMAKAGDASATPPYTIHREILRGINCVVIEVKDVCTSTKIYCDPTRNCELIRKETQKNLCHGGVPLIDTIDVEDSRSLATGIWFPSSVTHVISVNGKLLAKHKFEISSSEIVSDNDDKAFKLTIPVGWRVDDERYGVRFITGKSPEDLSKEVTKETQ